MRSLRFALLTMPKRRLDSLHPHERDVREELRGEHKGQGSEALGRRVNRWLGLQVVRGRVSVPEGGPYEGGSGGEASVRT